MSRVNQLWQDERERRAEALVTYGMDEGEAWEAASDSDSRSSEPRPGGAWGEARQSGGSEASASPNPTLPPIPESNPMKDESVPSIRERIARECEDDMRRALQFGRFLDDISRPTSAQEWPVNVQLPESDDQ